ncbi:ArsR/SmtB family transcription factor [Sporosarcina aquimarina]|uniref:Metalloregulator ArsR/SmtB family transcription factor n=1 Tax=Sporosarcina aquimarina TaxID=114975 RepID=A0ABU4G071_9BACL|nr:metalloregulator ArsR/SmtB family transcription factor [Sporosarcina aquimarina]MDW0109703.1 metalloregulator ArsR/SmtB family transcription factor [Sporosarcina aquimarina]
MSERQPTDIKSAATILKLLGDPTRLTMMKLLQSHDCCVCEFVAIFNRSQPAISQHIRKLKDVGLVKEERRGQWIFYSIRQDYEEIAFVLDLLDQLADQQALVTDLEAQGLRISCT